MCNGVPPGWKAPSAVTSKIAMLVAPVLALLAALVMAFVSPMLWVFSFFYDKIMFAFLDNE